MPGTAEAVVPVTKRYSVRLANRVVTRKNRVVTQKRKAGPTSAYFARPSPPNSPPDLANGDCINLRTPARDGINPWEDRFRNTRDQADAPRLWGFMWGRKDRLLIISKKYNRLSDKTGVP